MARIELSRLAKSAIDWYIKEKELKYRTADVWTDNNPGSFGRIIKSKAKLIPLEYKNITAIDEGPTVICFVTSDGKKYLVNKAEFRAATKKLVRRKKSERRKRETIM